MKRFHLLWSMIAQMTKWGVIGGASLGAAYGVVMTLLIMTDENADASIFFIMRGTVLLGLVIGLPFGIGYGSITGVALGLLNGIVLSLFTWGLSFFHIHWRLYFLGMGAVSAILTLTTGLVVFSKIASNPDSVLFYGIIPPSIATVFFVYASQRAARWYLATINSAE